MSFLPYANTKRLTWYGSMTASAATHLGIIGFFLFSGAVAFLPEPVETERRQAEFAVTFEILDVEIVTEAAVIDESLAVLADAVPLEPDQLQAALPDNLAPTEPDTQTLAPEETTLEPAQEFDPPEQITATEPDLAEPEIAALEETDGQPADPTLADTLEIQAEQAPIDPEPAQQSLAAIDTPNTEPPQPQDPLPIAAVEPPPSPLAIEGISPIDSSILNPLAQEGGGFLPDTELAQDATPSDTQNDTLTLEPQAAPEPDILALLEPEPTPDAPSGLTEDTPPEPVVLSEPQPILPQADAPAVAEPDVVDPAPTAPEAEAADPTETARLRTPSAPAPQVLPNPTTSDIAIGQLLRRIRATPQTRCTLILPRRASGTPGAGIALIGSDIDQLDDVADRITDGLDFTPVQTREEIDQRQCATLDALRQTDSYPASRIGVAVDDTTLESGGILTGRIIGAGGLHLTLLLVDDNGVVQDMTPFVSLENGVPAFAAPVARSGPVRATRQILLALGTKDAPLDVDAQLGNVAQTVFVTIPGPVLREMVFGIATFDVR